MSDRDLLAPLKRYWGYSSFRPLQDRIVGSIVEGRDTCVVMPTGGGKSLCYQLPALVLGKTAIVISPLIALMQDQAAQLAQMGIPAAVLNSTQSAAEQSRVMLKVRAGDYRLLYLSPERLAREDTVAWLQGVPTSFFAVDEAHCISEWGHEFRPEYRQLSKLRVHFPDRPIAAFTASATRRVRHDILEQLKLSNPDKYIASFHRKNLRYLVRECVSYEQNSLLARILARYQEGSVIVYAPTIQRVEQVTDFLIESGIPAISYHGQMDATTRRQNQERWTSDEVRVVVATIAFGLGINKASVRAVIHLSLPKSIEQYYQEAGRGGRDGAAADCVLLWQRQDTGLLAYFINKIEDPMEKERSWQRYREIVAFAEKQRCRHRQICLHFGEVPKWLDCGSCDVCTGLPSWIGAVEDSVPRGKRKRRRVVGEVSRDVIRVQNEGASVRPVTADPELLEYMREWRRRAAKDQGVAAFVVMHDTSLAEVCRIQPKSISELLTVSGFGARKAQTYGLKIIEVLKKFQAGARSSVRLEKMSRPAEETIRLLAQGKTFEEIAAVRGRQLGSVVSLVADLIEEGRLEFQPAWIDANKKNQIEAVCAKLGIERLHAIKAELLEQVTYEEIRIVVAQIRRQRSLAQSKSAS
ncbi:MAG TPA: RecQ family ATP-dependent DNA helicase [Terriglobales bacterium]|nr:RecQ family ATP-dependent DNA helicase [Terriglobales bacterium]